MSCHAPRLSANMSSRERNKIKQAKIGLIESLILFLSLQAPVRNLSIFTFHLLYLQMGHLHTLLARTKELRRTRRREDSSRVSKKSPRVFLLPRRELRPIQIDLRIRVLIQFVGGRARATLSTSSGMASIVMDLRQSGRQLLY